MAFWTENGKDIATQYVYFSHNYIPNIFLSSESHEKKCIEIRAFQDPIVQVSTTIGLRRPKKLIL